MLKLQGIKKNYELNGGISVEALKGIDLRFRKSEFVSILGPSGCGKTTLLNIIGGLDHPSAGRLVINGVSTDDYNDRDWDTYRNHSVGFVFQSYNLIPHMSVLANVELAPTISGVSKTERRKKAISALEKVGLGDQLYKKPNQMSGGQMQRVAIARALVNDPEILLCDEPTGALDTATSLQIMEILRGISKDRLIIMVTHNPDLAQQYSSRIIRLQDGMVVDDSDPYEVAEYESHSETAPAKRKKERQKERKKKEKKASMSFLTALSLSLRNLMTKKTRTFLTSFAGSIGIIGIAMILALSSGISAYIDDVQEDTLSSVPLSIKKYTGDTAAIFEAMTQTNADADFVYEDDRIYPNDTMGSMFSAMMQIQERDIVSFKNYFTENFENVKDSLNAYKYVYGLAVNIYVKNPGGKADTIMQTNPTTIFDYMGEDIKNMMASMSSLSGNMASMAFFGEMMEGLEDKNGNKELINPVVKMQYELVGKESRWPENSNEVLLVVDEKNRISNMALYALGFKDPDEIQKLLEPLTDPTKKYDNGIEEGFSYSLSDFVGHKFYYVMNADYYAPTEGYYTVNNKNYPVYEDLRERNDYDESAFLDQYGKELTIVGIVRKNASATSSSISTPIAYTAALTREITDYNDSSAVMKQQKETPEYDIFTGRTFEESKPSFDNIEGFLNTLSAEQKTFLLALINQTLETSITVETLPQLLASMPDAQFEALTKAYLPDASFTKEQIPEFLERIGLAGQAMLVENLKKQSAITEETLANALQLAGEKSFQRLVEAFLPEEKKTSYEKNLTLLGSNDDSQIQSINLYAVDFASKDQIKAFVEDYNKAVGEDKQVEVSDLMGSLLTGVSAVINAISYILIAFVSVSLVVSSIMIAIITYISVLERTKEIGILRSLGASKKNVRNVFNAETLIEGLCAGLLGVGVTLLLCLIANPIIHHLTGISSINAYLHPVAALILILISILLTMVAGLIPARMASKRDPVVALRTE